MSINTRVAMFLSLIGFQLFHFYLSWTFLYLAKLKEYINSALASKYLLTYYLRKEFLQTSSNFLLVEESHI